MTREAADRLASDGLLPLDYLVGVMRGTIEPDPVKLEAAKAAAPYMHPRLAAMDLVADVSTVAYDVSDKPLSEDEWAAQVASRSH